MLTLVLISINVAIFFLLPSAANYFGFMPQTMHNPINWITSMFLHANMMHLVMNMLALLQLGLLTEKVMSLKGYFSLYFLSGLAGTLASFMYMNSTGAEINVIGASGAIFGVFAYYSLSSGSMTSFFIQAGLFHGLILFLQLPVAWYAHAGGALMGLFLALVIPARQEY